MKKLNISDIHKTLKTAFMLLLLFCTFVLLVYCANRIERITVTPGEFKIPHSTSDIPYLKLHMKNGCVYSLKNWKYLEEEEIFTGSGSLLDINRKVIHKDNFSVPNEEIVLVETNQINMPPAVISYTLLAGVTVGFSIFCATNPKACFGSCPTFYVFDGEDFILEAEGFSSSVAPSLEALDIDAISKTKPSDSRLLLKVTNEALETHVIRKANILAAPHKTGNKVFSTPDNQFWEVSSLQKPDMCSGRNEDCLCEVSAYDDIERFSSADSSDLAKKETIELVFHNITQGKKGLIISYKQTLLTTFLFYQTLAYMGNDAGIWIAQIERHNNNTTSKIKHVGSLLGDIDVLLQDELGKWNKVGTIGETGPIAADVKLVLFPSMCHSDSLTVRLRMTKGLWRIDQVELATIVDKVKPIRIKPTKVFYKGFEDQKVLKQLLDENQVLVSLPGDEYQIYYDLPNNYHDYCYLIESQGYYLEWIRDEWVAEEDPFRIQQMFINPNQYLKDLAPQFKKIEAEMEESFWGSRYVIP